MFLVNCHLNIFTVNIIEHMWTGVVRPLLALHMFDHKLIELCHFSLFEQSLQIDWVQSTLSFSLQKVSLLFELGWHRQKHICQLMITNGIHAVSYWDVYSIILIFFSAPDTSVQFNDFSKLLNIQLFYEWHSST